MDLLETAATEVESLAIPEPQDATFATIGAIYEDGVTLIFDGQTAATEKHYKVNTSVVFAAGDRVKICKDSGTYVVEYAVGSPLKENSTEYPEKIKNLSIDGDFLSFRYVPNGMFTVKSDLEDNMYYIWNSYKKMPRPANYVTNRYYSSNASTDYDLQFRSAGDGSLEFKRTIDAYWTKIV